MAKTGGELNRMQDIQIVEVVPSEEWGAMPLQKMRTLLALLLKKISTPGGFVNFQDKTFVVFSKHFVFRTAEKTGIWNKID